MRGASKAAPRYRKHKTTGQAVVTLSGKDHDLGIFGSKASRQQYDVVVAQWLANDRLLPEAQSKGEIAVCELLVSYWKFAREFYVKNGLPTGEIPGLNSALRTFKESYGSVLVEDVGPLTLNR